MLRPVAASALALLLLAPSAAADENLDRLLGAAGDTGSALGALAGAFTGNVLVLARSFGGGFTAAVEEDVATCLATFWGGPTGLAAFDQLWLGEVVGACEDARAALPPL